MLANRLGFNAAATTAAIVEKAAAAAAAGGADAKDAAANRGLNKQTKNKAPKPVPKEKASEGQAAKSKDKSIPKFRAMYERG